MPGARLTAVLFVHVGACSPCATQRLLSRVWQLPLGGIGATRAQRADVGALVRAVEAQSARFAAPATHDADAALGGVWRVLYAEAPPPSNGQLGPLRGVALQRINVPARRYENELRVGEEERPWLRVRLGADWDALDAHTWRVHFRSLTVHARLLGKEVRLLERAFPDGTTRMWRFSFADGTVRVVRAGQGGGTVSEVRRALGTRETGQDDDCLFVLERLSSCEALRRSEASE
ncbi:hypothetical protein KFE25_008195 [Diacronema lutheri]|uniref:Plastid lipid-associated protein/fibrillin conserved domain-containing protein n=1 Tax=Diacronema lutheri TaxID=2081491 RepID=A0A8J5XNN6_DIALT|nr:hypothetical protein KFE25_008195 [Diacronema lutheri]